MTYSTSRPIDVASTSTRPTAPRQLFILPSGEEIHGSREFRLVGGNLHLTSGFREFIVATSCIPHNFLPKGSCSPQSISRHLS